MKNFEIMKIIMTFFIRNERTTKKVTVFYMKILYESSLSNQREKGAS